MAKRLFNQAFPAVMGFTSPRGLGLQPDWHSHSRSQVGIYTLHDICGSAASEKPWVGFTPFADPRHPA
jgi:hypothetical protein